MSLSSSGCIDILHLSTDFSSTDNDLNTLTQDCTQNIHIFSTMQQLTHLTAGIMKGALYQEMHKSFPNFGTEL